MKYLNIMKENIYTANVVMIMQRGENKYLRTLKIFVWKILTVCLRFFILGSPYQQRVDKLLMRMFETGLIQKEENQVG